MGIIVHNDFAQSAYQSQLETNMEVWNASSNNALLISDERMKGDSNTEKFWLDTMAVSHQDRLAVGNKTIVNANQGETNSIKIPWATPDMQQQINDLKRGNHSEEEWTAVMGMQSANHEMKFKIAAMIAALKGAIGSEATAQATATDFNVDAIIDLLHLFKDKEQALDMLLFHSNAHVRLVKNAIAAKLTGEAGVVVYGGQPATRDRRYLVTDEGTLSADATHHSIFALQTGAGRIKSNSEAPEIIIEKTGKTKNATISYTAEGTFNLEILGYKFTGGNDPDLAALASPVNWTKAYMDIKSTAGVMLTVAPVI